MSLQHCPRVQQIHRHAFSIFCFWLVSIFQVVHTLLTRFDSAEPYATCQNPPPADRSDCTAAAVSLGCDSTKVYAF